MELLLYCQWLEIIRDLINYVTREGIQQPVLLLIDRAPCHLSIQMSKLCRDNRIFPILLCPNIFKLTQALDLTFFAALKAGLKVAQEMWHMDLVNIGTSLNKYTVVPLVHTVTENVIREKPGLIAKGLKKNRNSSLGPTGSQCPEDGSVPDLRQEGGVKWYWGPGEKLEEDGQQGKGEKGHSEEEKSEKQGEQFA